jgi:lysophospholipase L1-like esterase
MANSLGSRFLVSVDALSGRTVNVDYPENIGTLPGADFNGARFLPSAVARELPLGLVIIMLGTNDARSDLDRSPHQIADGIFQLTELVKGSTGGVMTNYPAPRVLVVVPPHIEDTSNTPIGGVMEGAREKSQQLAEAVRIALINSNTPVFDASTVVRIGGIDGIHMTEIDHQRLGEALAVEVSTLMAN